MIPRFFLSCDASQSKRRICPQPTLRASPPDPQHNATPRKFCPQCETIVETCLGPGAGPHHARVECAVCGRFIAWQPRPRPTLSDLPPTQKQIDFLRRLGQVGPAPADRQAASDAIAALLLKGAVTGSGS
jgi:hypothetical protein